MGSQSFEPEDESLTVRNVALSDNSVAMTNVGPGGKLLTIIGVVYGYCEIAVTLSNGDCYLYRLSVGGAPRPSGAATTAPTATTTTAAKPVTTTTAKPAPAATTTTTVTTVTTTTETVTTTTADAVIPFRCGGFNEWGFINDRNQLGSKKQSNGRSYYTYNLSDNDIRTLLSMLRDTERAKIENRLDNPNQPVGGFCYGMSVTSVLAYYSVFYPSDLVSGMKFLSEIDENFCNADVKSAVNYYQLLQYTDAIEQTSRKTVSQADKKKLQPLIDSLSAGKPVVLGYTYEGQRKEKIGHAVVAYGIEFRNDSMHIYQRASDFNYDVHILIYDNITGGHSLENDLYIDTKGRNNSTEWQWCIPRTDEPHTAAGASQIVMNHSAYRSGCISLVLTEPDIMNIDGLFSGNTDNPVKYENAGVSYTPLNGLSTRGDYGLLEKAEDGSMNAAADTAKIQFSADFSDGSDGGDVSQIKASFDDTYGFYLAPKSGGSQAMAVSMEYENYLMDAKADLAEKIEFTPDAEIECINTSGNYALEMVVDKEVRSVDWHKITVTGRDGGNLKMQLEQGGKGFILSGDSLKNVKVHANTYDADAERTFSTNYASVRIYEIDVNTVGIQADSDGDGVYETEIPADTERQKGDADGDGEITNKDAQTVLVAYTDSLGTGVVDLPEAAFNAADVDGDGKVGAGDAQYILIYYTVNTIAGKPTAWEDVISQ